MAQSALRSIRLHEGRQVQLVCSPKDDWGFDAVDTSQGGVQLAPGQDIELPTLEAQPNDEALHYWVSCEDGQQAEFELRFAASCSSDAESSDASDTAESLRSAASSKGLCPWCRVSETEGCVALPGAGRVIALLSNGAAWFSSVTVHFELWLGPRTGERRVRPAPTPQEEEFGLRQAHTAELRAAEVRRAPVCPPHAPVQPHAAPARAAGTAGAAAAAAATAAGAGARSP